MPLEHAKSPYRVTPCQACYTGKVNAGGCQGGRGEIQHALPTPDAKRQVENQAVSPLGTAASPARIGAEKVRPFLGFLNWNETSRMRL